MELSFIRNHVNCNRINKLRDIQASKSSNSPDYPDGDAMQYAVKRVVKKLLQIKLSNKISNSFVFFCDIRYPDMRAESDNPFGAIFKVESEIDKDQVFLKTKHYLFKSLRNDQHEDKV